MHEMSIVEALLDVVRDELRPYPGARVHAVRVRVGQLRQVEPTTLEFCYKAATTDTPLAGSRLEIQPVRAAARCELCSLQFDVEENWFECPRCHSTNTRLLAGDEIELTSLDVDPMRN